MKCILPVLIPAMKTLRLFPFLAFALLSTTPALARQGRPRPTAKDELQNIAAGILIFIGDNKGVFATNQARLKTMVTNYLMTSDFWTAPGDPPGTLSFTINPLLAYKNMKGVSHPETLVLIYQGVGRDLYYQNGKCAVAFADGSVKMITPKESAKLRWKP